jgi:uncharacterized protein (DUF58 family)
MLRVAVIAACCAGLYANALWRNGFSDWFMLYVALVLGIQMVCTGLFVLRAVEVRHRLSTGSTMAGGSVEVELHISHSSWIPPLWLAVKENWSRADQEHIVFRKLLLLPAWSGDWTVRYRIVGIRRGRYQLQGVELVSGDVFGLWTRVKRIEGQAAFDVYPRPAASYHVQNRRAAVMDGDRLTASIRRMEASGTWMGSVRDYAPGDPPQRIHWKSFARSGELRTKEADPALPGSVVIALDASKMSYTGSDAIDRFDACVDVAAGLWRTAAGANMEVDVWASDASGDLGAAGSLGAAWQAAGASKGSAARLVDWPGVAYILAKLQPNGPDSFARWLHAMESTVPRGTELYVVTANLEESLEGMILKLRSGGRSIHMSYVYSGPALSYHERKSLERLQAAGVTAAPHLMPKKPYGPEVIYDVTA